ncbi:MAG: hypothetical protein R2877_06180 [Bdellovibrionota bacterium]
MDNKVFQNPQKTFSIVMFIQEDTFQSLRRDIEQLGKQRNIKFVVQPCPYEGIEFLYQVDLDFPGSFSSEEKELYWHALELKKNLSPEVLSEISVHHHQFLVSILQNDSKNVEKERKALQSLIQKNS